MPTSDAYWWIEAPLPAASRPPVAATSDVAIVGAGYTGLSAAITVY